MASPEYPSCTTVTITMEWMDKYFCTFFCMPCCAPMVSSASPNFPGVGICPYICEPRRHVMLNVRDVAWHWDFTRIRGFTTVYMK